MHRLVLLAVFAPLLAAQTASDARALLNQYCTGCHNQKLKTGGVALDTPDLAKVASGSNDSDAQLLEKVLRKFGSGEMPPAGLPRPSAPTATAFTQWLSGQLD